VEGTKLNKVAWLFGKKQMVVRAENDEIVWTSNVRHGNKLQVFHIMPTF